MGVITEVWESGRSTYIKCADSNRTFLRNRIFLRKDTIEEEENEEEDIDEDMEEESADMVVVRHDSSTTRPARSAMKQAWSRLEREEREKSRPARRQLRVRFSLPSASLPASQSVGSEE